MIAFLKSSPSDGENPAAFGKLSQGFAGDPRTCPFSQQHFPFHFTGRTQGSQRKPLSISWFARLCLHSRSSFRVPGPEEMVGVSPSRDATSPFLTTLQLLLLIFPHNLTLDHQHHHQTHKVPIVCATEHEKPLGCIRHSVSTQAHLFKGRQILHSQALFLRPSDDGCVCVHACSHVPSVAALQTLAGCVLQTCLWSSEWGAVLFPVRTETFTVLFLLSF